MDNVIQFNKKLLADDVDESWNVMQLQARNEISKYGFQEYLADEFLIYFKDIFDSFKKDLTYPVIDKDNAELAAIKLMFDKLEIDMKSHIAKLLCECFYRELAHFLEKKLKESN